MTERSEGFLYQDKLIVDYRYSEVILYQNELIVDCKAKARGTPYKFNNWNKKNARVAQLVERQPSKLNVAGSNPVSRSKSTFVIPAKAGISSFNK